jgi:cytochrome c oxidase subunit 4
MTDHSDQHDDDHGGDDHPHVDRKVFILVFVILSGLTVISFVFGNYGTEMGLSKEMTWVAMMLVSCAKAGLVICCFMHLWWEANWKWVLTIPASLMSIFLVIMLIPDIGCRTNRYTDERWNNAAPAVSETQDRTRPAPTVPERDMGGEN